MTDGNNEGQKQGIDENYDEDLQEARRQWEGMHDEEAWRHAHPVPDFSLNIIPAVKKVFKSLFKRIFR